VILFAVYQLCTGTAVLQEDAVEISSFRPPATCSKTILSQETGSKIGVGVSDVEICAYNAISETLSESDNSRDEFQRSFKLLYYFFLKSVRSCYFAFKTVWKLLKYLTESITAVT
jgi:hypothetical protein